jgi:hypothetical protein
MNEPTGVEAFVATTRQTRNREGSLSRLSHRRTDELPSELAKQTEHWIMSENAPH